MGTPDYDALQKRGWRITDTKPKMAVKEWNGIQLYIWSADTVGQTCMGIDKHDLFGIPFEVGMKAFQHIKEEVDA